MEGGPVGGRVDIRRREGRKGERGEEEWRGRESRNQKGPREVQLHRRNNKRERRVREENRGRTKGRERER